MASLRPWLAVLMLVALPATDVSAQRALQEESDDERRLRSWLALRAERSRPGRDIGLASAGAVGFVSAGIGVRLADDTLESTITAGAFVGAGAVLLALAVARGASSDIDGADLARLPARALSPRELGYFEGRLQLQAQLARRRRFRRRFVGGAYILTGIAAAALVASGEDRRRRVDTIAYAASAGIGVVGLVFLITSFFESSAEADWREYREGLMPRPTAGVRWHVSPTGFGARF
ncbi:MAG: hypothetical protein AAGE52_23840 [Myxococcota bacterium]